MFSRKSAVHKVKGDKVKRLFAIWLCLALVATGVMAGEKSKTRNVTFILKNLSNPPCISVLETLLKASKEFDINLSVRTPVEIDDNDELLQLTRQSVDTGACDLMIMFPADSIKFVPAVQMAYDAGIPVVMLIANIRHDKQIYSSFVATENRDVGLSIGEKLAEVMDYKGNVALIEGVPGAQNSVDRVGGVADALKAHKDINILTTVPSLVEKGVSYRESGRRAMLPLLEQYPEMEYVWVFTDEIALGVIDAIEAAGKSGKITVAGCSGTMDGFKAVKEGKMSFTCDIRPHEQGYQAMATAAKILDGEEVPARIVTKSRIIDRGNVDEVLK